MIHEGKPLPVHHGDTGATTKEEAKKMYRETMYRVWGRVEDIPLALVEDLDFTKIPLPCLVEEPKVSRKRLVKLLMAKGISRNKANALAGWWRDYAPYRYHPGITMWRTSQIRLIMIG